MTGMGLRRGLGVVVSVALAGGAGGLTAGDGERRICSASDLGLSPSDVPVSTCAKVAYLLNPILNRPAELEPLLRSPPEAPLPPGLSLASFDEASLRALLAPARPGDTAAYAAVVDVVESFFRFMFTQVPWTERSLARIVEEVNREEFPLAAVDASPRLITDAGKGRWIETVVTIRLFMVRVEGDRDRNLRWVTRCELLYEDAAVGRAPFAQDGDAPAALARSVLDALRGKIAVSFTRTPAIRRSSGRLEEPRRDLIDRSISEGALEAGGLGGPAVLPPTGGKG